MCLYPYFHINNNSIIYYTKIGASREIVKRFSICTKCNDNMCGIFAVFDKNVDSFRDKILCGYDELKGRGPEQHHLIVTTNYVLGFRRLAINGIDSDIATQPFIRNNVYTLCNGEIYNHSLLEYTHWLRCTTGSDCECIAQMYEHANAQNAHANAEQIFSQLNGDFACIIYDDNTSTVLFTRDRIGVRPLYIGRTPNGGIALASIANALTPFCTDIEHLTPAMYKVDLNQYDKYDDIKSMIVKHWNWPTYVDSVMIEDTQRIYELLNQSVNMRMMSERPIGCLLSGGLDSSIIAVLLSNISGHQLQTFSIGMEGSEDLKHAKIVAEYLGTNHHEVIFTEQEGLATIDDIIRTCATYDITTIRASIPMYLLSKWIRANTNIKVLFSGEGSDELFGGYLYFHFAPSPDEFAQETNSRMQNIYLYDGLRADRCVSSHGLELRVPFLDQDFVDYVLSINGAIRMPRDGMEKYILRRAFEGKLPESVLWRRKDGLSDGVSGKREWATIIREHLKCVHDEAEPAYYKRRFNEIFGDAFKPTIVPWMPKWIDCNDPSGRLLMKHIMTCKIQTD